jgi:hypothetical protein
LKITIDTEGVEYDPLELMALSYEIQISWIKMGRGLSEVFSMNFDTTKYQEKVLIKQKQEKSCEKPKPETLKGLR